MGNAYEKYIFKVYVGQRVNTRKELFVLDQIMAPNPKCYVCTDKPEVK